MKTMYALALALMALAAEPGHAQSIPAVSDTARSASEAAAVAWINADGHALSGADASPSELAPLAARLAGARVIGLGEVTHGDHEDHHFKADLIEELVRQGAIHAIVLEANRDVARNFDLYVRDGKGDPVALMRSTSFFRVFRDEEFAGLLTWLRAWNQIAAKPVRILGVDDQDGGRDAGFALALIARHDPALAEKLGAPFKSIIAGKDGVWLKPSTWIRGLDPAQIAAAKAGARVLADTVKAHAADWGQDPDYAEAAYAAEVAWQNIDIFELEGAGTKLMTDPPQGYYARRDTFMAQNMMARLGPEEHAAFWAHNGHVAADLPPSYAAMDGTTVGHELRRTLGDGYRALGFEYSKGEIMIIVGDLSKVTAATTAETAWTAVNDQPGELGFVFAQAKANALWLDLAHRPHSALLDAWMKLPYQDGSAGWGVDPADWTTPMKPEDFVALDHAFDVVVWFRTLTPSRRLPALPVSQPTK